MADCMKFEFRGLSLRMTIIVLESSQGSSRMRALLVLSKHGNNSSTDAIEANFAFGNLSM